MRLILLFACLFSFAANAADYFWQYSGNSAKFLSAVSACEARHVSGGYPAQGQGSVYDHLVMNSPDVAECFRKVPNFGIYSYGIVSRGGDSCPANTNYNSATGECEKSKCDALSGTSKPFSKSGTAGDNYMTLTPGPKPIAIAVQAGCFDGCMASTADQKCTTKTSGAYFCRGTAWFDGQSCASTGTPGVDSSSTSQYPDSQQTTDTKPCNYTTNADGTQSCTSSKGTEKEGQICGTVSATGQKICVDAPPSKTGIDISTTVKSETDGNGKTTTTKTDTATTTKCSDIKTCTSNSTTVTTVIKGDGSVSSTCKGANCPDKNTNPDGDGDGFGDCVTGDCGEGEGSGEGAGLAEFDDVDDYGETLSKFYDKVTNSPIANSVTGLSIPSGGSCSVKTADLGYAGVQSTSAFCDLAPQILGPLRMLCLAIWAWSAIRLFMTA